MAVFNILFSALNDPSLRQVTEFILGFITGLGIGFIVIRTCKWVLDRVERKRGG